MPNAPYSILSYLRVVVAAWREETRNDAELLAHFAESRDEAAFATLVWRHGPLVWRTCCHILGDTPDGEDAFQAVFLTLARKAGRFPVESLAGWLYRTARRAALDAKAGARRRQSLEHHLRAVTPSETVGSTSRAELYAALDEELAGLPEKLRVVLLLRYLEGKSQDEVAHFLGCSRSAVRKRLVRAEALLRERLERRGLGGGIVSVGVLLGGVGAAPAVPLRLIGSTARAAVAFRDGTLSGGAVEAAAQLLLKSSGCGKSWVMKAWLAAMVCACGLGGVAWTWNAGQPNSEAVDPLAASPEEPPRPPAGGMDDKVRLDAYGDPLPPGATARIGSVRLRQPSVTHLAFSADGKSFVAGDIWSTLRVWDLDSGKELRRLQGYPKGVLFLAYSPVSQLVAFWDGDRANGIRLWDAARGKEIPVQEPFKCNLNIDITLASK
jgi:RNA polymerase sigma factor (sigma-70 family)